MSKSPPLGSLAVQAPSLHPQLVHVSPATCHNLSLFKDLLREYRRLDDTINMRLNRTNAQFRDRDREGKSKGNVQDETCMYIWQSLVENWRRRTEIVSYCVEVVDKSIDAKQQAIEEFEEDAHSRRSTQAALYSDKVKRQQVHNELAVESIVRRRSLDAFKSRCKYFIPPMSDVEARKWWDSARESM